MLDALNYCASFDNLDASVKTSPNFLFVKGDVRSADLVNYVLNQVWGLVSLLGKISELGGLSMNISMVGRSMTGRSMVKSLCAG